MDATDLKILVALEANGRQSFTNLAEAMGMSKTPCWTRVQALEQSGAISGYSANIDGRAGGLGVVAILQVDINPHQRTEFEEAVRANDAILECYTTAGDADYILKIVCRDVDDVYDVLRHNISPMPGLSKSSTTICLKSVKSRGSVAVAARRLWQKT